MPDSGYELVRLGNGACSIRSLAHAETFHPVVGAAVEAEALYVRQLRLPERLSQAGGEFVIWDVGLGGAANTLAVLHAARAFSRPVRVVSFDQTLEALEFGLSHATDLGYFVGYEETARRLLAERKVNFQNGASLANWVTHVADFPALIREWAEGARPASAPPPDAILFDPCSPAVNPEMWTLPVFTHLFRPGTRRPLADF